MMLFMVRMLYWNTRFRDDSIVLALYFLLKKILSNDCKS